MAGKCSAPKTVSVKSYWRAPRKRRAHPRHGEHYVAENAGGRTCGHHHKTWSSAHACAASLNRKVGRKEGRKAASYLTEKRSK